MVLVLNESTARGNLAPLERLNAPRKYASAIMIERRKRIVAEALALIKENGTEGFTIRELSLQAGVAQRTLYNVFESKEDIIAASIHDQFAGLLDELSPPPPVEDIEGLIRRVRTIAQRAVGLRQYATAIVSVFFSSMIDSRVYDSLRWVNLAGTGAWVERAEQANVLINLGQVDRERLITLMLNASYGNVNDWVSRRISDAEYIQRAQMNFLLNISYFVRPKYRVIVKKLLLRV